VNRRLIALASLSLAIVFLVRVWVPSDRAMRTIPALPDTRFDYTLNDFRSEFFNSQGQLEWLIEAPTLTHESSTKTALIDAPTVVIEPNGSRLDARADRGRIIRDEDIIILTGNVVVRQTLLEGERVITSETLHHNRRQRTIVAETDVNITEPGAKLRSERLRIDLDSETLEFYDHVQGEIDMDRRADDGPASGR
jgi:LPS export ABC transporter protein LptC